MLCISVRGRHIRSGARAVSTTCSMYMRSSNATVSWNKCRWRSYSWHLGDASTTYAFCKRCSTHCRNLRQFRQSAYAKDDVINRQRLPQDTDAPAYSFLPADVIGDEVGKLEQVAAARDDTRVQKHLQYVRRNWVDGCWRSATWSVFRQPVRINNYVEGWHHRPNVKARHGRLNLSQLL